MKRAQYKYILIILYLTAVPTVRAVSIGFDSEVITITVNDSNCIVSGDYYFRNPDSVSRQQNLLYPVVLNEKLPFPDFFSVREKVSGTVILFSVGKYGITFPIRVESRAKKSYVVEYRQSCPAGYFEYILTTTGTWGQPLRSADYYIRIPDSIQLTGFSLPYDSMWKKHGYTIYHLHRENYMPEQNIVISWKEN